MEANRNRKRWTYAEFARLPSEGSTRYEVIDGDLVVTLSPSYGHQRIVTTLITRLNVFVTEHALGQMLAGPFDILFAEGDYFEPDLLFVRKDRLSIVSDRGAEAAPDLVVEIASPSTAYRDRGIKLERYRLYGVAEYWVVDPDCETVEVWHLVKGADAPVVLTRSDTLTWRPVEPGPTLTLPLSEVFPRS